MNRMAAALAAASLSLVTAVSAETAFDLAFRTGTLAGFDAGDRLDYRSDVTLPEGGGAGSSTVSVELEEGGVAAMGEVPQDGDVARHLGQFDAGVGNPLGMFFLERTIRNVSEQTGGSPFYLRNRIKDALRAPEEMREVVVDWRGQQVDATEIVLAPFDGDPNRDALGAFGDLRIRMVVGEEVPGWYHTLRAEAGGGAFNLVLSLAEVVE
jgi:hypothetical protein